MGKSAFDDIPDLSPLSFFSLSGKLKKSKGIPSGPLKRRSFLLDGTTDLTCEERFASVYGAWHEDGISFEIDVKKEFNHSYLPKFATGDAVEIFIDTRDLKSAGFLTRFCHHFLFLPKEVDGVFATELTKFRTEDSHELARDEDFVVTADKKNIKIFIPAHVLHDYDPASFSRIGFTYRIHRYRGSAQDLAPSSWHFPPEQQPSLWPSFQLINN